MIFSEFRLSLIAAAIAWIAACTSPAKLVIDPESAVIDGANQTLQLTATILDDNNKEIKEGFDVVWFTADSRIVKLNETGQLTSIASGEAKIEADIVGTEIRAISKVRVKIPGSIKTSHDRLRLWQGQQKENVWAEVRSEKDAFIEGYLPTWSSEDPTVVKVEQIVDPNRRQSWVKMEGLKPGVTRIQAKYKHLSKDIRVAVYDENQEYALDGRPINKSDKDTTQIENKSK